MPDAPTILVVDDDLAQHLLVKRLLKSEPYRLAFATDGQDGLSQALELTPDLILTDVVMPGMNGYELCRAVRENEWLAEVPVLMLTGLEDASSKMKGLEAGADDFISKPFRPNELRARIKTILRLNRYRRIRNERARFGWVVEHAEEGYLIIDGEGQLQYSNAKANTILSLPKDSEDLDLLAHLERQFTANPEGALERWPELSDQPFQLVRPETSNAPAAWIQVNSTSHSVQGRIERLLQLRDITAQMSTQRSVWTFNSLVAHKLRTPMTKMIWGLSFIVDRAHRLDTKKIVEFAKMAQGGVEELKNELDDVLSYLYAPSALPEGSGFCLERLESVAQEVASQLEIKPIRCHLDAQGPVRLSDRALEMALWELFQNSKKFHPENSPQIEVEVGVSNGSATVRVRDDGVTLSPEQLRNAFLPYYQGERHFTGQIPGMGLGLSMISSMVLEVGGDCQIRNREDRDGVVVELQLPVE